MPEIYVFGSSTTWGAWDHEGGGWAQRLRSDIDRIPAGRPDLWCPVYNLGIPGDTSTGVAARIRNEISARHGPPPPLTMLK